MITYEIVHQRWTNYPISKESGGCRLWNSPEKQSGDALDWMRRRSTSRCGRLEERRESAQETLDHYRAQVRAYLDMTGAERGLTVLMTNGTVIPVLRSRSH